MFMRNMVERALMQHECWSVYFVLFLCWAIVGVWIMNKKTKLDDSDPEPPDCFRITQISLQTLPQEEPSFLFNDDFWKNSSIDWSLLELSAPPPPLPPLYYLMVYDHNIMNVRTFCADSKTACLQKFLICYINQAHTEISRNAQAHLHAKVPHMPIHLEENEYAIVCNAGGGLCKHTEVAESRESLIVQLFAHFVAEHCKNSEWHKSISKNIAGSEEEARAKLYGPH